MSVRSMIKILQYFATECQIVIIILHIMKGSKTKLNQIHLLIFILNQSN